MNLFSLILCAVLAGTSAACAQTSAPPDASPPEATNPNSAPATAGDDKEDEGALSFNFEADFASRYVFRGVPLSSGAVVQPGLYLSKGDSTVGVWANINASGRGGVNRTARQANEVDITYTRSLQRGRTVIEPAAVVYLYPTNLGPTSGEISLRLARGVGKWTLFTSHSVDFLKYKGAYFGEIGLSREREFGPRLAGEISLSLGGANAKYNEVNIGARKRALNVAALDLSLTRRLNEKFYLRPHLRLTCILDSELRAQLDDPTVWNLALAVGSNF